MKKRFILRNGFCPVIVFTISITQKKNIHDQTILYHFLQYNPSNYDKTITTKHILPIYYLTNVNYTQKVYSSRKSLLTFRKELQLKNFEF